MHPLITARELLNLDNFILIEAGNNAKARFEVEHLEGALFVDLDEDLAAHNPNPEIGGRHPLPPITQFAGLLAKLGINPSSHVIVYDDKKAANAAARFWWMLKAIGHEKIQVLNGGLQAAIATGFPISSTITVPTPTPNYPVKDWLLPQVNLKTVKSASKTGNKLIIDVRDENRYLGLTEPLDSIAGHIPNAINIPLTTNLNEKGEFLSSAVLKEKYETVFNGKTSENVIVHCGSGVTACHTLLAVASAGLQIPNLYVGSWSEWSRNDLPIARASN